MKHVSTVFSPLASSLPTKATSISLSPVPYKFSKINMHTLLVSYFNNWFPMRIENKIIYQNKWYYLSIIVTAPLKSKQNRLYKQETNRWFSQNSVNFIQLFWNTWIKNSIGCLKNMPKNNIKSNHIDRGNWYDCTCPMIPNNLSQKCKGFVDSCYIILTTE